MSDRWSIDQVETELGQLLRLEFPRKCEVWNETHWYYFRMLFTLIFYVRDVKMKGEYTVSYAMIYVLYQYHPEIALNAVEWLVFMNTESGAPKYGCWKDMKKLAEYVYTKTDDMRHPLIHKCIMLLNRELRNGNSNVAKWIPREKSKHDWMFELLALDWLDLLDSNMYLKLPFTLEKPDFQIEKWKVINGAKRKYRQYISGKNRLLNTTEIYMCNDRAHIVPENVNLATLHKNMDSLTNSFNNKTMIHNKKAFEIYSWTSKYYNQQSHLLYGTLLEYETYISKQYQGGIEKNRHMNRYSKLATKLGVEDLTFGDTLFRNILEMDIDQTELKRYCDVKNSIDLLNREWLHICGKCNTVYNVLPILDMSLTMFQHNNEPWNNALSLACLIASKSTLGGRILVMDHIPTWVNVDNEKQWLVKMANKVNGVNGKTRKSLESTITILAESVLQSKMTHESIEELVFVFLSDMLFDLGEETLHSVIHKIYNDYFVSQNETVPPLPHIIYWNVGGATQIPCDIYQSRASFVGGNTTALLDILDNVQLKSRRMMNPFKYMSNALTSPRYTDVFQSVKIMITEVLVFDQ
jgi:hypothetical protein